MHLGLAVGESHGLLSFGPQLVAEFLLCFGGAETSDGYLTDGGLGGNLVPNERVGDDIGTAQHQNEDTNTDAYPQRFLAFLLPSHP